MQTTKLIVKTALIGMLFASPASAQIDLGGLATNDFLILLVVGLIAGFLASRVVGVGGGLLMDLVVGVIGAFLGRWLFGLFNVSLGPGVLRRHGPHRFARRLTAVPGRQRPLLDAGRIELND